MLYIPNTYFPYLCTIKTNPIQNLSRQNDEKGFYITGDRPCHILPSWENMQKDDALWLMVAPWCGGGAFDHGNTPEFWKQLLSEENVISRGE